MGFKEILVHVDSTVASTSRVWLSLAIARRCGSRVIGLHAIQNPDVPQYFKPSDAERVANLYMESAREAATMAESQFRRDVKDAGVETEWRSADGDVARGLAEHGRFADLIVVGQDDTENPSIIEPFLLPQKVVMASGMPVLVIPVGPTLPSFGRRISLPGMAAARQLVPFMTRSLCSSRHVRLRFWPSIQPGKVTLDQAPIPPPWPLTSKDTESPPK